MTTIRHKSTGRVLYTAENASDLRAALIEAVGKGAYLVGAYLGGADLRGADLRGADLGGADLVGADLRGAYGVSPHRVTPLLMLHDQPGRIVAYKLVTEDGRGPAYGSLTYRVGAALTVTDADTDTSVQCGRGINLATLDWCMAAWSAGMRILRCSFTAKDIAAVPTGTDGKFRVHRCKVVSEVDLDEIGLTEKEAVA